MRKKYLVWIVCLVVLGLAGTAPAIDREFTAMWRNPLENSVGSPKEVAFFVLGWRLNNAVDGTGDPAYERLTVPVDDPRYRSFNEQVLIYDVIENDIVGFAVKACGTHAKCSPWSDETSYVEPPAPDPGTEGDDIPATPVPVFLVVQ